MCVCGIDAGLGFGFRMSQSHYCPHVDMVSHPFVLCLHPMQWGYTALHNATNRDHSAAVELLIRHKATATPTPSSNNYPYNITGNDGMDCRSSLAPSSVQADPLPNCEGAGLAVARRCCLGVTHLLCLTHSVIFKTTNNMIGPSDD